LSFKIITPRPELRGKIDRRDLLKLGMAATGGAMLPASMFAQADLVPSEDNPPSTNTTTPEAPLGGLFDQGILPANRVLLYYGFPEVDQMGILGEYTPEELLPILEQQKAEYEAVRPDDRPWVTGFELIGSVAQSEPGADGMYVADTDGKWLDQYTIFTHENDMQLFIDIQMGRKAPHEDYEGLERWMRYPHVHLAIDPEFHLPKEGVPGEALGQIHANDVTRAQEWLVGLSDKYGLPRKMLIIHQFHVYSVGEKELIAPMDGVDLVMNEDGHGTPEMKLETYRVIIKEHPIQYNGFKIFYRVDIDLWENSRLMTPTDVYAMDPVPDLVNYQ
jgi:hypothetical protein